jgi:hypothetical protein
MVITREVVEARTKMYYEEWLWEDVPSLINGKELSEFAEEVISRLGNPFETMPDFLMEDPITRELDTLEEVVNAIDQEIERAIA